MEKLQLEYIYKAYNFEERDTSEWTIDRKKDLIMEIFEDCRKNKVRYIPDVYHKNDELYELEKRYKYYILKDMRAMNKEDYVLDFMLMGILLLETFSKNNDFGINLHGFTKTIIRDKTEYKDLIKQICDEYLTPENFQNNLLLRLGAKLLLKGFDFKKY
jgi:hypothetical protein